MALAAGVLEDIRQWVGSNPADSVLETKYLRLGTVEAVALQVLRARLADMVADPARFQVDGDASWSFERNMSELRKSITQLEALTPPPTDPEVSMPSAEMQVGRIVRSGRER